MLTDSLSHDIMNESAFDIANSMIQSDLSLGASHSVLSTIGSPNYRSHPLDFGDAKLDDDDLFHAVTGGDVTMSQCNGMSTRLRRRKASQPQRLVYCDLDYSGQDDFNSLETLGDKCPFGLPLITEQTVHNLTGGTTVFDTNHTIEKVDQEVIEQTVQLHQDVVSEQPTANFLCKVCDTLWTTKSRLRSHQRSHGEKKSFQCDICDKTFGWEYSWKTHMLAHSDDNPHKCTICNMKFFNKTALSNHIKRKHEKPERPFSCEQCSKKFISKSELNQHSAIHSEHKPFM